jgi:cytochrome c biogenesis protein CcmG/thiol:disulfide interchange protein DsbE
MHSLNIKSILALILWVVMSLANPVSAADAPAETAPDFSLPTDHSSLRLSDLRGKVVYLDFWASWCGPCRSTFPWMNDIQARYGDQGLVIVAVNVDKDKALASQFLAQLPAKFTIAYDPQGSVAGMYKIIGMPSSFLIDRDGKIQLVHPGFREKDKAELESQIRQLVSKTPNPQPK